MNWTTVVPIIGYLAGGGILHRFWDGIFGGKKRKLDEATILSNLSTQIREEIRRENEDLRISIQLMVESVCGLVDMLDELFPKFSGLNAEERIALRERIAQARRAAWPTGTM